MGEKKIFPSLLLTLKNKNLQEIPEREILFFPGMETGLLGRTEQRRGGSSYYPGQFSVIFRTFFKCLRLYDRIGTREKGG